MSSPSHTESRRPPLITACERAGRMADTEALLTAKRAGRGCSSAERMRR